MEIFIQKILLLLHDGTVCLNPRDASTEQLSVAVTLILWMLSQTCCFQGECICIHNEIRIFTS